MYPAFDYVDCDGNCLNDTNGNGLCDETETSGCTNPLACNYVDGATIDDGSCDTTSCAGCTDALACNYDASASINDGSCDYVSCFGCTDALACNYDATALFDDGGCAYPASALVDCDATASMTPMPMASVTNRRPWVARIWRLATSTLPPPLTMAVARA